MIHVAILSGNLDICLYHRVGIFGISSENLSGISSGILIGISSDHRFGILPGPWHYFSGISSGVLCGIACGIFFFAAMGAKSVRGPALRQL